MINKILKAFASEIKRLNGNFFTSFDAVISVEKFLIKNHIDESYTGIRDNQQNVGYVRLNNTGIKESVSFNELSTSKQRTSCGAMNGLIEVVLPIRIVAIGFHRTHDQLFQALMETFYQIDFQKLGTNDRNAGISDVIKFYPTRYYGHTETVAKLELEDVAKWSENMPMVAFDGELRYQGDFTKQCTDLCDPELCAVVEETGGLYREGRVSFNLSSIPDISQIRLTGLSNNLLCTQVIPSTYDVDASLSVIDHIYNFAAQINNQSGNTVTATVDGYTLNISFTNPQFDCCGAMINWEVEDLQDNSVTNYRSQVICT